MVKSPSRLRPSPWHDHAPNIHAGAFLPRRFQRPQALMVQTSAIVACSNSAPRRAEQPEQLELSKQTTSRAAREGLASLMRPMRPLSMNARRFCRYAAVRTDTAAIIAALYPGGVMLFSGP